MEKRLELICYEIDAIIRRHDGIDRVAGGYVVNNAYLLTTDGTLFAGAEMLRDIERRFSCRAVATVGAIMLTGAILDGLNFDHIETGQASNKNVIELQKCDYAVSAKGATADKPIPLPYSHTMTIKKGGK